MTLLKKYPARPREKGFTPPYEKLEQAAVTNLFLATGARVFNMSQYRASHVAVGISDLYVMHERRRVAWWFECKRYHAIWTNGDETVCFDPFKRETWMPLTMSKAQQDFRASCLACGVPHFWGGRREAEDALVEVGLAQRGANGLELVAIR